MSSERQRAILRVLVDQYLEAGQPIGSKLIAAREDVPWSASTVRSELAGLEDQGFLTHPHTSAGRVPTDAGYRIYVDSLLSSGETLPAPRRGIELEVSRMRQEVDEAMRETTSALAGITDMLALVTAPPLHTATIHRIEVLLLQAHLVMVVVITSAGGVSKRVFAFDSDVDPGLVDWSSAYLNERLAGMGLGARMLAGRLDDPELSATERRFVERIAEAFTGLEEGAEDSLYVDGAARLLSEERFPQVEHIEGVMEALERRASVLAMLRSALDRRSVYIWIGGENPQPELRSVSVVGANYGLGHRNLGAVGVIGPLRMDYATAIASVREAAGELSRFFETVYDG